MQSIDFKALRYPTSPNKYLVCPKNYCNVTPFADSPTFQVSVDRLKALTQKVLLQQPRVKLLSTSNDGLQQQYVQRSLIFRFPDYIDIRFIAINENLSTLAIYSRSKYGHSDFGVNENRVKLWLKLLLEA